MARLVWLLGIDLMASGVGLAAGWWIGKRRGDRLPVPSFWPWVVVALLALALDTLAAAFPTLTGRLPSWVQRGAEPTLWGLALASLAFGVAFARWPQKLVRLVELARTFLRMSKAKSAEVLLADYLRSTTAPTKPATQP